VVFITSTETATMVGRIITARMSPEAMYPSPIGGPEKIGRKPRCFPSQGWIDSRSQGTTMKRPHRP